MEKQPDSPIQHNFAKQKWQPIHLIIALKHPAWLISLFFSLSSFFLVFKSNSAELFPLLCPNYYLLLLYTFSLFYWMFLGDWGLQHLACCPISVRSGGCYWAGGTSGAVCTVFLATAFHPSKMFMPTPLLKHWQVFPFLYNFSLFAFLWLSNRTQNFQNYRVTLYVLTN